MKIFRTLMLSVAALTGLGLSLQAADTFEGRVEMTLTTAKKKKSAADEFKMNYAIKGDKIRIDMDMAKNEDGGMDGMIFDLKNKEMIMLMNNDGQKMSMRRPFGEEMEKAAKKAKPEAEPVATGRKETILGYQATEYKIENKNKTSTEIWLAKGLGTYFAAQGGMGGKGPESAAWEKIARDGNLFPMRVINYNKKGEETDRMEVTKIDKGRVPDSVFSTEGYEEFKIPGFGGGAGGLNPFKRD